MPGAGKVTDTVQEHRQRSTPAWLLLTAFAAAYAVTYWTSDVFRLAETGSTPWNPEAGLAVAALLLFGSRMVPLLVSVHFLCLAVWAPFSTLPWTAALAAGHMLSIAAATHWLHKDLRGISVPGSRSASRFIAAALLMTIASACVQMLTAVFGTDWSAAKIFRFGMTVSVGNMVGILTVLPLASSYPAFQGIRKFPQDIGWRGALLLVLLVVTSIAVFGIPGLDQFKFFYLVFVPVIAISLRHGLVGAAIAALTASICMILVLSLRDYSATAVAELQFLMIVLTVTGLVLGATIDERERAHTENLAFLSRLRENEDALMRASRISLASEMVAAVAHELAQPLSAARSHVRAMRRRLALARRDRKKDMENIDTAVQQIDVAATTIRGMREFLRRGDTGRAPIDLGQLLETAVELMRPELRRSGLAVETRGFSGLPLAIGNRTQLSQVLFNLVRNAKEALLEGDTHTGTVTVEAARTRPGYVEVRVTDTGPGVPDHIRPGLFAPLRSSKPDGLGLGLSLSKSIIVAHGGDLWHDPLFIRGSRFCFTVPVADSEGGNGAGLQDQ